MVRNKASQFANCDQFFEHCEITNFQESYESTFFDDYIVFLINFFLLVLLVPSTLTPTPNKLK